MLKKTLVIRASALMFSVFFVLSALGCPNAAASKGQPNPNPNPNPKPLPGEIPENLRLHSIEAAIVNRNNRIGTYKPVENFNSKMEGPYAAEDAETAYIAFKVKPSEKLAEEAGGVSIFAENMNTYIPKAELKKDSEYFINKALPLSKGVNTFVITINGVQTYKITVNYAGGPDGGDRIIPGIYCPAQRKPSQGEKEEFVWGMFIAYGGPLVNNLLKAAGKDRKIYEKYKEKGLRIVIIGSPPNAIQAVKNQGLNLPVYSKEDNIFEKFFSFNVFPEDVYIVEGEKKGGNLGAKPVKEYEPIIKKVFGF